MIGHIGAKVGALVDGQLPPAEAERMWAHAMRCASCHEAIVQEGWVKTRLAGLRGDSRALQPPQHLAASLRRPPVDHPGPLPASHARRHPVALAVLGAGSVGAAMVGVLALALPTPGPGPDRRGPATSVTRMTEAPIPAQGEVQPVGVTTPGPAAGATVTELDFPGWLRTNE